MPKSVNLPLYDDFLKIFIDNEITNWQAKHFWEKMPFDNEYNKNILKAKMYRGLTILVQHKYLKKRKKMGLNQRYRAKRCKQLIDLLRK